MIKWVPLLGLYKTYLNSKDKDATIKDLNLEIQYILSHPSLNTESLYTKHLKSCPFLYEIENFLQRL
jgi:hypothetical protein